MRANRARAALPVILSLTLVLSAIAVLAAGCGDNTSTKTAATVRTETVETPIAMPEPEPGTPPVEAQEQTSPYGPGLTTPQTVGTLIDGLQLKNVRWADHGTYFRVVFEMGTPDGQPVVQPPHAEASINGSTIRVVLGGIRSIGDSPNVTAKGLAVGDPLVTSINRINEGDDQALVYNIVLTQPTTYSLAGLGSPGRVIIDINKI